MSLKILNKWRDLSIPGSDTQHWDRRRLFSRSPTEFPHVYYPEIYIDKHTNRCEFWLVAEGVRYEIGTVGHEKAKQILDADAVMKGWYLL